MSTESFKNTTPSPKSSAEPTAPEVAAEANATVEAAPEAASESVVDGPPLSELEVAQAKAAESQERYLRTLADFENFRRRTVREKEELRQYAASKVLEDLLAPLDNLGHGLAAASAPNATVASLVDGMTMVSNQLISTLEKHGLKQINPVGEIFDPNFHEALTHQPDAEVPAEHVVQVIRIGYTLNGRLLRAASVLVSSGPAA